MPLISNIIIIPFLAFNFYNSPRMQKIDLTYIVTMKLVSDANKNKYTFKLLHHPSVIIYPIEIALSHVPMCTPIQRAGSKMFAKIIVLKFK